MTLSIITINYNNRDGLEKTIKSVVGQTVHNFEYIVIDGASEDRSIEVIQQYADGIEYWVSEEDTGIYNAMNKGVMAAHGDYCLFLNSGDILIANNIMERISSYDLSADIISGGIKLSMGKVVKAPKHITMKTFVIGSLPHQATLIKRDLLLANPYDERLEIGSDWRFFIQVLIYQNVSYNRIPEIISLFDTGGISSTASKQSERRLYEKDLCRDILPIRVEEDYQLAHFIANWKWRFEKLFYMITHLFS